MEQTLYNPENIKTILHKNEGKIVLTENQQFQVFYQNKNIKKIEIWETRTNGLLYRVAYFLGKSILMINI